MDMTSKAIATAVSPTMRLPRVTTSPTLVPPALAFPKRSPLTLAVSSANETANGLPALRTGGVVESARVFLGGVGSRPQEARAAGEFLVGRRLGEEEVVREAARLAAQVAKPLQNTDFSLGWRKQVAREYAARALRELAG